MPAFLAGYNAGGTPPASGAGARGRCVVYRTQETAVAAVERPNDNWRAAPGTGYPPCGRRTRGMASHRGYAGTDLSGRVINTGIYR
ncbi:hypothetical protein CSX04_02425 [Burkholderia cepacia]|nr:hypothetical protein CSX04_02425 [Burkholderia cepacia]